MLIKWKMSGSGHAVIPPVLIEFVALIWEQGYIDILIIISFYSKNIKILSTSSLTIWNQLSCFKEFAYACLFQKNYGLLIRFISLKISVEPDPMRQDLEVG